jgi:hypothetical protein
LAITSQGVTLRPRLTNDGATVDLPVPGSLILLHADSATVALPIHLLRTTFTSHVLYADGIETAASGYFGGGTSPGRSAGVSSGAG